jgi:hypothetical protein
MPSERILIVGGQGPIGAWIARALLSEGLDFLLLERRPDNSVLAQVLDPEALPRLRRVFGDPRDPALIVRTAAAQGITHILPVLEVGTPELAVPGGPRVDLQGIAVYGVGCRAGAGGAVTRTIRAAALGRRSTVPLASPVRLAHVEDAALISIAASLGRLGEGGPFAPPSEEVAPCTLLKALEEAIPDCAGRIAAGSDFAGNPVILESPIDVPPAAPSVPRTPLVEGIRRTADLFRRMAEEGRLQEEGAGEEPKA